MVLKSYAKINLSLSINKKLSNGLHEIQSIYCLVDLYDLITIKKNKKVKKTHKNFFIFYTTFYYEFRDLEPKQ